MKAMKTFGIMIMIIIMPIFSQAYDNSRSSEDWFGSGFKCGATCAAKCLPKLKSVIKYPLCLAPCLAGCRKKPLDVAYDCLNGCDSINSIDVNFVTYAFHFLYHLFYDSCTFFFIQLIIFFFMFLIINFTCR